MSGLYSAGEAGYMARPNCRSTKKERKNPGMRRLLEVKCSHSNRCVSASFHGHRIICRGQTRGVQLPRRFQRIQPDPDASG